MAEGSGRSDEFKVWVKEERMILTRERALLWRIKNAKRIGEDVNRRIGPAGHLVSLRRKEVLTILSPVILEILFHENPLGQLVAALKEASTETVNIDQKKS